jgi:SAM-dependent methyltransferase
LRQIYDEIGVGYRKHRQPDARLAARIDRALGQATSMVNVGAGAGAYEPNDRSVVAVEPSVQMIRQRPRGSRPVVRASATDLPFGDDMFGAALAVLTVHHWPDRARGLAEMARVARDRVVILTFDPAATGFWLVEDYFPEIREIDARNLPSIDAFREVLGDVEVQPFPIPHDCTDGFLGAYWRRPNAYLDVGVRGAISAFPQMRDVESGVQRLRRDLQDGTWEQKNGHLLNESEIDLGYRLIVSGRDVELGS